MTDWERDLRAEIVREFRSTESIRRAMIEWKPLSDAEKERAFRSCAEIGSWNRAHPDSAVTTRDLIEIVPAIGAIA